MTQETNINNKQPRSKNGMGVAGMVIAIVGACLSWLPVFGLILLALGTVLSAVGLIMGISKNKQIGMSIAGLAIGVVFGIFSIMWTVAATEAVDTLIDGMEQLSEDLEDIEEEMDADLEELEDMEDEMNEDLEDLEDLEDEILEELEELEEDLDSY